MMNTSIIMLSTLFVVLLFPSSTSSSPMGFEALDTFATETIAQMRKSAQAAMRRLQGGVTTDGGGATDYIKPDDLAQKIAAFNITTWVDPSKIGGEGSWGPVPPTSPPPVPMSGGPEHTLPVKDRTGVQYERPDQCPVGDEAGPLNPIDDPTDVCWIQAFDPNYPNYGCWGRRQGPHVIPPAIVSSVICSRDKTVCFSSDTVCDAEPPFGYPGVKFTSGSECNGYMPEDPIACDYSKEECVDMYAHCKINVCDVSTGHTPTPADPRVLGVGPGNPGDNPYGAQITFPASSSTTTTTTPSARRLQEDNTLASTEAPTRLISIGDQQEERDAWVIGNITVSSSSVPGGSSTIPSQCKKGFYVYGEKYYCWLLEAVEASAASTTIFAIGAPVVETTIIITKDIDIIGITRDDATLLQGKVWAKGTWVAPPPTHLISMQVYPSASIVVSSASVSIINFQFNDIPETNYGFLHFLSDSQDHKFRFVNNKMTNCARGIVIDSNNVGTVFISASHFTDTNAGVRLLSTFPSLPSTPMTLVVQDTTFTSTKKEDIVFDKYGKQKHFGLLDFGYANVQIIRSSFSRQLQGLLITGIAGSMTLVKSTCEVVDEAAIYAKAGIGKVLHVAIRESNFKLHRKSREAPGRAVIHILRDAPGALYVTQDSTFIRLGEGEGDMSSTTEASHGHFHHFALRDPVDVDYAFTAHFRNQTYSSTSSKTYIDDTTMMKCNAHANVLKIEGCAGGDREFSDTSMGCYANPSCLKTFNMCQMRESGCSATAQRHRRLTNTLEHLSQAAHSCTSRKSTDALVKATS